MFTKQRIEEISLGYDLDSGGYSFEQASEEFCNLVGDDYLLYYDGDPNYFPMVDDRRGKRGSTACYLFRPFEYGDVTWPEHLPSPWGDTRYKLVAHGWLNDTDHDCTWCEGAGEVVDSEDHDIKIPCSRCNGDGHVESPGGSWAAYDYEHIEVEEE